MLEYADDDYPRRAEQYASIHFLEATHRQSSTRNVDWNGWGSYTKRDDKWFKS